ncbi:uncharacterized protein LOC108485987 [Gossypium arboreum]|nr:uncharacterized protein LOC108485987 [Gossypium arboreum]
MAYNNTREKRRALLLLRSPPRHNNTREKRRALLLLRSPPRPLAEPPGVQRPSNRRENTGAHPNSESEVSEAWRRWRVVGQNGARGGLADEERRLKTLAARVAAVFFVMG